MTAGRQRLDELFAAKQQEMLAVLQGVRSVVDHPSMKGTASEENWRTLLGQYLPERYRIESGKVIDSKGAQSDQIDVIILDQQYSPLLFESGDQKYFPAESVYAVLEVKQVLNKENLEYAAALCRRGWHLDQDLWHRHIAGAEHDEAAWASRLWFPVKLFERM